MRNSLGWILVIAGLLLIGYPFYEKITYDRQQQELLAAFDQLGEMGGMSFPAQQKSVKASTIPNEKNSSLLNGTRGIIKTDVSVLEDKETPQLILVTCTLLEAGNRPTG
ncbi:MULTISPECIES: hypothetical protein [Sporosarcina]|uniref:Sortase A n=1 Tax=Sporosarcina newyorkensis TaxID=759851 RepID=A0A1T4YBL6_9BACL|nr:MULTISPECIES: hypothetical protein [Sporosarcina]MBY0223599.1 hypothetical protein [Sporosarcina aquimarina]SKA99100.1 sortase A [Sporosarcina newyorkensis]